MQKNIEKILKKTLKRCYYKYVNSNKKERKVEK